MYAKTYQNICRYHSRMWPFKYNRVMERSPPSKILTSDPISGSQERAFISTEAEYKIASSLLKAMSKTILVWPLKVYANDNYVEIPKYANFQQRISSNTSCGMFQMKRPNILHNKLPYLPNVWDITHSLCPTRFFCGKLAYKVHFKVLVIFKRPLHIFGGRDGPILLFPH